MNTPVEAGGHFGPYELRERLGQGGMAQVWKAWNGGLARFEALKFPLAQAAGPGNESTFITRFLGEARLAASLHHPHIATIYSVSSDMERPYFAMQFITGNGLDDLIGQQGKMSVDETLAILEPVAAALDYAHERGVVHRDIKPANILLQERPGGGWHPIVVDFGIARAVQEDGTQGPRLTGEGGFVGTAEYMSPEQIQSFPTTAATDVYSLGVVAYEMLCGRPPFPVLEGSNTLWVLMQHVKEVPPRPESVGADVSSAVAKALLWALQKNPAERPPSCRAWIEAMQSAALPRPVAVSTPKTPGAKPLWLVPLAAVGVFCAIGVGYSAFRPSSTQSIASVSSPSLSATATPTVAVATSTAVPSSGNSTIIVVAPTSTPVSERDSGVIPRPTPDAKKVQSQKLAKQAGEKVDTSTAVLQELMSRPQDQPVTEADKATYKRQISALNAAYDLALHAVQLDERNEEGWVALCRATVYLDKCGEEKFVQKVAARFPQSSRFKPLVAMAKSYAKDGCY